MIDRVGNALIVDGGFVNSREVEVMPQLAEYLLKKDDLDVEYVMVYGIKETHVYMVCKCRQTKKAERIFEKISEAGESKKVGDIVLARIPLGIAAIIEDRFKKSQYIREIIMEIFEIKEDRKKFKTRLEEIKKIITN